MNITDEQVRVVLPNECGFEQWYVENAFDYERNPLGSHDCMIARKAWHAALEAFVANLSAEPVEDRCECGGILITGCLSCGESWGGERPATARAGVDLEDVRLVIQFAGMEPCTDEDVENMRKADAARDRLLALIDGEKYV